MTGDEGLYIMAGMTNRCAVDDSVVFSHHSPWLIVVCTLSEGPVSHKDVHEHANTSKHACMFTRYYIYLNSRSFGRRGSPTLPRARAGDKECESKRGREVSHPLR